MAPTLHLGRRARLALKIGGFILLGLIAFVFSLQMTFDYDRVKDKFLVEALASKYEVTVKKVSRGFMPGKFTMEKVVLKSRTTKPDEVAQIMVFDTIEVDVGILGLLGGDLDADVEATIGKGTLTGTASFAFNGSSFSVDLHGARISGDAIPQLQELIGLPLLGKIDVSVALAVSGNDWRKARGSFQIGCPKGCTFGDDKTKFKRPIKNERQAAMMKDGIEFGHIDVDKMLGRVELKNGTLEVTKWEWDSREADMRFELEMKAGKRLKDLELESGCMKYKALPALIARDSKTATALTLIGGILGPEDLYYVKLECMGGRQTCTYANIKPRSKVCGKGVAGADDSSGDVSSSGMTRPPGKPSLGAITTGSGTAEPGADVQPVPQFFDAAPAPPPEPPPMQPPEPAGSGSGSGSGSGTGTGSAGDMGSGEGSATAPTLAPGPAPVEHLGAPANGNGEVQPEPPPPVNPKESD